MYSLAIQKRSYSVHPWRIVLTHPDGKTQELAHFSFPRKKDAAPVLAALQALPADWAISPYDWPEDLRHQVRNLMEQTPGYQLHQRALQSVPGYTRRHR